MDILGSFVEEPHLFGVRSYLYQFGRWLKKSIARETIHLVFSIEKSKNPKQLKSKEVKGMISQNATNDVFFKLFPLRT